MLGSQHLLLQHLHTSLLSSLCSTSVAGMPVVLHPPSCLSASASGADVSEILLLTLLGPASMPHVTADAMAPLSSIRAMTCPSLNVGPLLLPFQGPPPV